MSFELPALDYAFNALEPHIDARTMEIHHGKHHQAYVTNLNNALKDNAAALSSGLEEIIRNISKYAPAVRNNGGGHWNHSMFWKVMSPNGGGTPGGDLGTAITATFGSFDAMREQFNQAAATRFGSGWAWLVLHDGKLVITSTPNQDNPLMDIADVKGTPILGLDVWEHAYYLHYQNRRPDYIGAFWNVVNWEEVSRRYAAAL
ncbi:MAG: superoxide dismutase [Bacteroidia bacterium]|jgi:Fe-Mn family superoxide dismutase